MVKPSLLTPMAVWYWGRCNCTILHRLRHQAHFGIKSWQRGKRLERKAAGKRARMCNSPLHPSLPTIHISSAYEQVSCLQSIAFFAPTGARSSNDRRLGFDSVRFIPTPFQANAYAGSRYKHNLARDVPGSAAIAFVNSPGLCGFPKTPRKLAVLLGKNLASSTYLPACGSLFPCIFTSRSVSYYPVLNPPVFFKSMVAHSYQIRPPRQCLPIDQFSQRTFSSRPRSQQMWQVAPPIPVSHRCF